MRSRIADALAWLLGLGTALADTVDDMLLGDEIVLENQ